MPQSYASAQLGIGTGTTDLVRDLQRDLRALGYLRQGIDGIFQRGTDLAVRRLQYDLLNNTGISTGADGHAPVAIADYNKGRVTAETGVVDTGLAGCIEEMLGDPNLPKLPSTADPAAANRAARAAIAAMGGAMAPTPFLLAILRQESAGKHFAEPSAHDTDNFVVIGLDANPATASRVTSRGYGMGQYTLFHHPPRPEELQDFILDPTRNVQTALSVLRDKFNTEVLSADDRAADHPVLKALRRCRYPATDSRYMRDCHACAMQAKKRDLTPTTPVYADTTTTYGQAPHYTPTMYRGVPDRADFLCDWPYAVRRYNGAGADSYNYQARVLLNLLSELTS